MSTNGFRGSSLPPSKRLTQGAQLSTPAGAPSAGTERGAARALTNDLLLADYLASVGPQELNLVVVNRGGRAETDVALANLLDLFDLVTLRTSHGREPSTFQKELMPGLFAAPTPVQEAMGEWGIQGAVDLLLEGLPTLGPRRLLPPPGDATGPMMWVLSAGDARLGEQLYAAVDRIHRPHRHMWSHHEDASDSLRWALLAQLSDADVDEVFPDLRRQHGFQVFLQRSDRFLERLNPQTGQRS